MGASDEAGDGIQQNVGRRWRRRQLFVMVSPANDGDDDDVTALVIDRRDLHSPPYVKMPFEKHCIS